MSVFLCLRRLKLQNANAMSSPYTIGFPAMTAWMGAVHALERKVSREDAFQEIRFPRMAVACHEFELQTYRGEGDYVNSVIISSNPLRKKGAAFERPPFIEEARVHLTVSLLIEVAGLNVDKVEAFIQKVRECLMKMKIAGGDILGQAELTEDDLRFVNEEDEKNVRKMIRRLMPGYVLIERRDLMEKAMGDGLNGMEALLRYLSVHHHADGKNEKGEVTSWSASREEDGWIVPIAVGFKGITPLEKVTNQRDADTPHRFAESVVTLGEFRMAHHFDSLEDMLWEYDYREMENLYLCRNQK